MTKAERKSAAKKKRKQIQIKDSKLVLQNQLMSATDKKKKKKKND